uniref:Ribosomal biogenesis protein LAS1L n=1 Tax=Culex pipiens TaxID=7175 RepID=A0A8D8BYQ6_CULPI
MNINALPQEFPPSNIDLKRKEVSHISAWRDKEEFNAVYKQIFCSPKGDIGARERAAETLKVWKIRQNRHTPVSVLCTLAILEVQNRDSRQGDKVQANELKSLYSGAFTRFINFLTECHQQSGAGRKGSISARMKEIGIEGFLVELRHLCAHSSVSISLDVFRRSAEYCMNWLKVCYWKRELQLIQSCEGRQVKGGTLLDKIGDDLRYLVNVYDIGTKAIHKGARMIVGSEQHLTSSQFKLLKEHAEANNENQLSTIVSDVVEYMLEKLKFPKTPEATPAICDVLLNCQYMFEAAAKGQTQGLAQIHQQFVQTLVVKGFIQSYLEKLIAICEDDLEAPERRQGARFWATEIALAFRLLKKFKKLLKALPERTHQYKQQDHKRKMSKTVLAIYQNKLRVDLQNTIIIGTSVNCPWHLRLSRGYLMERILNVNEYTKELLPLILALAEPHLKLSQRESIEAATEKYTLNYLAVIEDQPEELPSSTPKRSAAAGGRSQAKVYSLEDVLKHTTEGAGEEAPASKKARKFGVWSEVPIDEGADWGQCPLGKLMWD